MPPTKKKTAPKKKHYSDKDKIAYYKSLALGQGRRMVANYKKPYKYPGVGRQIGGTIGSIYGPAGKLLGEAVGQGAHALTKTVTGFGDYKVKGNALVYNKDAVPEFSNHHRCTYITHREYITDIYSGPTLEGNSTGFSVQGFRINPGIITTFPWLANVSSNYEQYVVQGMLFEYKTNSATAVSSTNTALGTVILATQYNSLSPEFTTKQQMENYEFSQSTVPSMSVIHAIECDPKQTQSNGVFNVWNPFNSSGDIRLYDIGHFSIATQGMQAVNVNLGELWVTYKICFMKPRLSNITQAADLWVLDIGSIDNNNPFGSTGAAQLTPLSTGISSLVAGNKIVISPNFVGTLMVGATYVDNIGATGPDCYSGMFSTPTGSTITLANAFADPSVTGGAFTGQIGTGVSIVPSSQQYVFAVCPGGPNQIIQNISANFSPDFLSQLAAATLHIASINVNSSELINM